MARPLSPRRRTSQPAQPVTIDWSNPLTRGLVLAYYGSKQNWQAVPAMGQPTLTGMVDVRSTVDGLSWDYNGSARANWLAAATGTNPSEATLFALAAPDVVAGTAEYTVISQSHSASTNPLFRIELRGASASPPGWAAQFRSDAGGTPLYALGASGSIGRLDNLAAVFRTGTGQKELWVNGALVGTNTDNIGTITLNRSEVGTMQRTAPSAFFDGAIPLAAIWKRALTEVEIRALYQNPWQIFAPRRRKIIAVPTGGPATYTYSGAGTVTLSGDAALDKIKSYTGAGTVTLSGAAAVAKTHAFAGSGTVALSGAATTAITVPGATTYPYNGAGSVTLSGAAAVTKLRSYAGSGTVTLSGASTTSYTPGLIVYPYAGSGTISLSGAATTSGPFARKGKSGGTHKRRRTRIIRDDQLTPQDRHRLGIPEPVTEQPEDETVAAKPKRARRIGKAQRGIQLAQAQATAPEAAQAQIAADILAERTAELMASQGERQAMRAEELAMLQAAVSIEEENQAMLLLLTAL